MQLIGYRVTNFRSVDDSGWINTDSVTSLIGVNESGKTNLQIPLWKLNPAQEGEIHPNSDYPKRILGPFEKTLKISPSSPQSSLCKLSSRTSWQPWRTWAAT